MNRDNYPFWKEAPLGKSKPLIPRFVSIEGIFEAFQG